MFFLTVCGLVCGSTVMVSFWGGGSLHFFKKFFKRRIGISLSGTTVDVATSVSFPPDWNQLTNDDTAQT